MSAPKKTTKAIKSPAPASKETKATKPAAKKASAKVTAPAKAPTPAAKAAAATASIVAAVARAAAPAFIAPSATPTTAAAVKEVTRTSVRTTITAQIDIGFGNTLYVRGEGPGLSWDRGVPMANIGADCWQLELGETNRPFTFKFLVNDLTWSVGADFTIAAGGSATFTPEF